MTQNRKSKFTFIQENTRIQDVKFDTKPVGYFKDAFRRFKRNKSSVVALYIIILLLLFAIFAQVVSPYKTTDVDGYYSNVLPKASAFSSLGWDGSKVETVNQSGYDLYDAIGKETSSLTNNQEFSPIKELKSKNVNSSSQTIYKLQIDSYLKIGFVYTNLTEEEYIRLQAYQEKANIQVIYPIVDYYTATLNANIWYRLNLEEQIDAYECHNATRPTQSPYSGLAQRDEEGNFVAAYLGTSSISKANYYSSLRLDGEIVDGKGTYTYLTPSFRMNGKIVTNEDGSIKYDAKDNYYYQYAVQNQTGYKVRVNYYEYYKYQNTAYSYDGNVDLTSKTKTSEEYINAINSFTFDLKSGFYPEFWFGTNDKGRDIFTLLGSGARLSFILAIFVSFINLTIGALYGAIEGYYGGTLDLVMERICDILSSVPFIVVATLFSLHLAERLGPLVSLIFAFVLTGWISMASRVRMQFYRFKGQEYVLASRTLGVGNFEIMFKHIFPNALGTIITGSILSIPGVIFSESMLSYLNIIDLETSGFTSIGTMLSNGSSYISTSPHIILFPALFISLLMISFNLFGNGLRDAFNPSLRGS